MRMVKVVLVFCLTISMLLTCVSAAVSMVDKTRSDIYQFSDGGNVRGARSSVTRTDAAISMNLHTAKLPSGSATTVWWVIFNHPEHCMHGREGVRCGEEDLENEAVHASVVYADGHVVRTSGRASFSARLRKGNTHGVIMGDGLTNPRGADIHLIVRNHGPVIQGLVRDMTHTFGGGCINAPGEFGEAGPNSCEDVQISVHESSGRFVE